MKTILMILTGVMITWTFLSSMGVQHQIHRLQQIEDQLEQEHQEAVKMANLPGAVWNGWVEGSTPCTTSPDGSTTCWIPPNVKDRPPSDLIKQMDDTLKEAKKLHHLVDKHMAQDRVQGRMEEFSPSYTNYTAEPLRSYIDPASIAGCTGQTSLDLYACTLTLPPPTIEEFNATR